MSRGQAIDVISKALGDPDKRGSLSGAAIYDALQAAGMVVVPEEPTPTMKARGRHALDGVVMAKEDGIKGEASDVMLQVYRAMIAAHQSGEGEG